MTQNNLYMDSDDLRLYVDVQPLFIDELENSKNAAAASAQSAAQSASNAQNWLDNIISYKTNLELYYAQSINNLSDWYDNTVADLVNIKNEILQAVQTLYNTVINQINTLCQQKISQIQSICQNYVNIAKNYAEQAQNTVDNRVSLEHLNCSKALETGEVSSDSDVLSWVKKIAHSTFCGYQASDVSPLDPKKFVKVGSPIITDDGIASGFNSTSALKKSVNYSYQNTQEFICEFDYIHKVDASQTQVLFSSINTNQSNARYIEVNIDPSDNKMIGWLKSSDSSFLKGNIIFVDGTNYHIKITSDLQRNMSVYVNDVLDIQMAYSSDKEVSINEIYFGNRNTLDRPCYGSIDLKGVNITVDGIPVFSGNKTGIDTIKTTDFTVATSAMKAFVYDTHTIYADSDSAPTELYNADGTLYAGSDWTIDGTTVKYGANTATYTSASNITSVTNPPLPFDAGLKITDDGIASGFKFSPETDIKKSIDFSNADSFVIKGKYYNNTGYEINQAVFELYDTVNNITKMRFGVQANGTISTFYYPNSDTSVTNNQNFKTITLKTWNDFKITYDGTNLNVYINDMITSVFSVSVTKSWYQHPMQLWIGLGSNQQAWKGSIDLNSFKVYVDGNLVYQPCLKIPYTESKTGSKIADSVYRDRVNDMYEQFGYAPYYTLSDTDFTLPQGELYGMIEGLRKLLIQAGS